MKNKGEGLFDFNCGLGFCSTSGGARTANDLLKEMNRLGIDEALVYSISAKRGNWQTGNQALVKETEKQPRLHPSWVLVPPLSNEADMQKEGILDSMRTSDVRAVRMFPIIHQFRVDAITCGPLFDILDKIKIPLILDYRGSGSKNEMVDWSALGQISERWTHLPFVLAGLDMTCPRTVYAYLLRHQNLYIETSAWQSAQGISDVIKRFGRHRLLFGTGYPDQDPGIGLGLINGRQVSPTERDAIGRGNALSLISGKIPKSVAKSEQTTTSMKFPYKLIDIHTHIGAAYWAFGPAVNEKTAIEEMRKAGIEHVVFSSFAGLAIDAVQSNAWSAQVCEKYPLKFSAWAVYDPNQPGASIEDCRMRLKEPGFVGVKIHTGLHEVDVDDERYWHIFQLLHEEKSVVLMHANLDGHFDALFKRVCEECPEVTLVLAHHGGHADIPHLRKLEKCFKTNKNVWVDTCLSNSRPGFLKELISTVGSDRVCYSSDYPYLDFDGMLGKIYYADINDDDKKKILRTNALRLLKKLK